LVSWTTQSERTIGHKTYLEQSLNKGLLQMSDVTDNVTSSVNCSQCSGYLCNVKPEIKLPKVKLVKKEITIRK